MPTVKAVTLPTPPTERGHTAAALLIVAAGFTALWLRFNPSEAPAAAQFPSDLLNYFYPHADYVGRRLAALDLPLWNPHLCAGLPILAIAQTAVLYPGTWLYGFIPASQALPLLMLVQCLAGGGFTALYLRALGLGPVASGTGGVLYVASCMLGQTFWPPQVSVLLWLPWQLLCVEKLLTGTGWRWWVGLVAGVALQILAGFPQLAAYSLLLVVPYAGARLLKRSGTGALPTRCVGGRIGAAVLLGFGIASAQLLPTWELVNEGDRAETLSAREVHYLAGAVSSQQALRSSVDPAPKFPAFDFGDGGHYLGIATLILFAVGVGCAPGSVSIPLIALGALGLLLGDGYRGVAGPLYEGFASLPILGSFRTPERLRLLSLVAVVVIACVGLDALGRGFAGVRRYRLWFACLTGGGVAAAIAVFGESGAGWRAALAVALIGAGIAVRGRPGVRVATQCALGLMLIVDVTYATGPDGPWRRFPNAWSESFHSFGFRVIDAEPLDALRAEVEPQRIEVLGALPLQGAGAIASVSRSDCYEPLAPRAWSDLQRHLHRATRSSGWQPDPSALAAFHDAASVARIVVVRADGEPDVEALTAANSRFAQIYRDQNGPRAGPPPEHRVEVIENDDALPRAYWVAHGVSGSRAETIGRVVDGSLDLHHTVVVEPHDEPRDEQPGWRAQPAEIRLDSPERIEVEFDAPISGWLVLTDAYYPGWTATVDDESTPVLRANGLFRALRVPAGPHRAIFRYEPASFRWGVAGSIASLFATAAIPIVARRRFTAGNRAFEVAP